MRVGPSGFPGSQSPTQEEFIMLYLHTVPGRNVLVNDSMVMQVLHGHGQLGGHEHGLNGGHTAGIGGILQEGLQIAHTARGGVEHKGCGKVLDGDAQHGHDIRMRCLVQHH